ncbi:AraC-type DNA-binding protein [Chryseobacterium oranimense]|uniref:AraC-type DNA-binding protein n=1 Tax=Chryseobacterium oranimense TaxID=421058 RepID=A0A1M5UKV3_9FLAO|nr:helix-turn-helix domain-containing protein [Chryseobacterium oranimense]SHH63654.1 AraC-type DNA-binding protein [Chryseobacterium oranimense]
MKKDSAYTLINKQNGNLAFKLFYFDDNSSFDHISYNNFYTVIWVREGRGLLRSDCNEYLFSENALFAFSPYQPFMFSTDETFSGVAIQFHSDFYCIHKISQETNCDKLVFNNIYEQPFIYLDDVTSNKLEQLIEQFKDEFSESADGAYKLLVPTLIIFLVTIARKKAKIKNKEPIYTETNTPFVLRKLKNAIEENFREKHSPGDYAALLNISPNALAKIVKSHFNKTLTNLINERIIIEAKRELYLTNKSIKEISWELGYSDEHYFSRFFKANTDISPQMYRDSVGFGKAELN